ncbi:reprolysin-like metallopeptidase [Streptomyces alboflavus]|uniref:reprolysin-like metallopeptidase n=1 Tax=Streptomyces alboflavus TaxID=67267 RepID=UPI0004BE76A5|nr:zinc-dependent metalloprotease family protein [Streptomyces alboflavus]
MVPVRFLVIGAVAALTATLTAAPSPAAPGPAAAPTPGLPGQLRSGEVTWAENAFGALCRRGTVAAPDRRALPLFDGKSVTAHAKKVTRDREGTLLWSGHLAGHPDRPVTLAVDGACAGGRPRVAGEITAGQVRYALEAVRPGVSRIRSFDTARQTPLVRDGLRLERTVRPAAPPSRRAEPADPVIDVLIGYTPATAKDTEGGADALALQAKAAVEGTNQAYADSQVKARLNLLGTFETPEWSGSAADLDGMTGALADPDDPEYADEWAAGVRATRDAKGADLVHVLSRFTPGAGTYTAGTGMTPSLPRLVPGDNARYSTDGTGFGAQQADTFGTHHLAHEIGHNFGLNHDYVTDPVDPSAADYRAGNYNPYYPDNHGFLPEDRTWVDIMGYDMSCASEDKCENKMWFSNPRQDHDGKPRGVALGSPEPADSTRVMNLTGPVLANYRTPADSTAPERHALTAVPQDGTGGTVTTASTGLFAAGDQVTITATPDSGHKIDRWIVDGKVQPTRAASLSVTMDSNHYVAVKFIKSTAPLSPIPAALTAVSPDTGSVDGGFTVTLTGGGLTGTTQILVGTPTAGGFRGVAATNVRVVDDAHVTFTAPAYPDAGPVQIATARGNAMTASIGFTYTD